MSVAGALEVLGLTGSPSREEIRRAYLRKVKEHPPERDRAGFQQVRDAFELLKRFGPSDDAPIASLVETSDAVPAPTPPVETSDAVPIAAPLPVPMPPLTAEVVDPELESVERALAADDPVAAAQAMIALLSRPPAELGPVPAPLFTLRTFMTLFERNRFETGRALLDAFESFQARHGAEGGLGAEVGARWKLAREVAALSDADEPMARAVAQSLNGGHIYTSAEAVQDAYARGVPIERMMQQHAPTVWASLSPYVQINREEVRRATGVHVPNWAIGVFLVAAVNIIRLCTVDVPDPPNISFPGSHPVQTEEERRPQTDERPAAPPAPTLGFRERAQRDVDSKWLTLAGMAERGDCDGVRDAWSDYRKIADPEIVNATVARERKRVILDNCSELGDLFDDHP